MKLRVYSKKEKSISLKLRHDILGGVSLDVVDSGGARVLSGSLLDVKDDGTIFVYASVAAELGFQLDERGHLKVIME